MIPTEYMLTYLAVLLASTIALVLFSYLDYSRDKKLKSFMKDPVGDLLKSSDERLKCEIKLYAKFDEYPIDALIQARNYLTRKKSLIESVSNMLVGVLTKVGLLPAILAILISVFKVHSGSGYSLISLVAFVLVGIYFFCFKLNEASVRFEEYQSIVGDYIEMKQSNK